jgi:hypothetical protein
MIDPDTIITLLAGGAIAKLQGLGGDMAADAYAGLKQILHDGYGFAASRLEKSPKDPHACEIAAQDIVPNALQDSEVLLRAKSLEAALVTISRESWAEAGVIIEGLTANRTIEIGKVTGGARGVTIRNLHAEGGDVKIGDVRG